MHRDRHAVTLAVTMLLLVLPLSTISLRGASPATQGTARAGAAEVDITPLPGLPTGGHGPASRVARGYWGRLRAVAFYFEDPSGRGLALVSAELFAVPSMLHTQVADHFRPGNPANTTGVVLPLERLVIAATHTHHGPGNYMSAKVYNANGSSRDGYNKPLRQFLVREIIRAIEAAILSARSTSQASVEVVSGTVDSTLFRNRSPKVFMRDGHHEAILAALGPRIPEDAASCQAARLHHEPEDAWNVDGCPRLRAVDRNVTVLRIRHGVRIHALGLFVNAHPTVLPAGTALFSADLFHVTRVKLEDRFAGNAPVIGFFNGGEGDVVSRRTTRTAVDLVAIGEAFAEQIYRIHEQATTTTLDLDGGVHGRLHYAQPGAAEPSSGTPAARLAAEAMAGVAALGGAEGDETLVRPFTWRRTRKPTGDQGVKVPALGWFRKFRAPPETFPQALPLGVIRIGTLTLATTPTENSTAAIRQIRSALGGAPHGQLEVISMANEYASYLATMDEYSEQDYMGASTMWGPEQATFFAAVLQRIGGEPDGRTGEPGKDAPGSTHVFRPGDVGRWRARPHDGYGDLLKGGFVPGNDLPAFQWCEPAPDPALDHVPAGDRQVEVVSTDESFRDVHGTMIILRGIRSTPRLAVWAAVWLTPLWEQRRDAYRFRVTTGIQTIESDRFAVGTSPPAACK